MTVQAGVDGIGIAAGARAGAIRESGYSQADTVAARLERLPMTSYQRGIFLDHRDRLVLRLHGPGLVDVRARLDQPEFGLTSAQAGLLSSMSFLGMFLGASTRRHAGRPLRPQAGLPDQHGLLGRRQPLVRPCVPIVVCWRLPALCWASAWAWSSRSLRHRVGDPPGRRSAAATWPSRGLLAARLHRRRPDELWLLSWFGLARRYSP